MRSLKMNKYIVDYMDDDGEICSVEVEGSAVVDDTRVIQFFDEYNEDNYAFYSKDILSVRKEK
jgi:hypothetical protein